MAKDVYSKASIEAARHRLPEQGCKNLKALLARVDEEIERRSGDGNTSDLQHFASAVRTVLAQRPVEVDADCAKRNAEAEKSAKGMTLYEATRIAFEIFPASPQEQSILPIIAANPGARAAELERLYGKGDFTLCVGHIVYDRYGCFRHLQSGHSDYSKIIIEKEKEGGATTYRLRPEAEAALRDLGLI